MGSYLSATDFALVIPTLNEEENIGTLLDSVQEVLEPLGISYEVIIVDDNSSDYTPQVVRSRARHDSRIQLLTRVGKRGLAGAVLEGWSRSKAAVLGVMDADLQHPPGLLPALLEAVQAGADLAIASRYAHDNGVTGWNPIRAAISRLSTLATLPFLRKKARVTDPMSGFFVLRRECIDGIAFQPQGFKLLLEILVRGRAKQIREVPYHFGVRHAGKSKAGPAVAYYYLHLLGRLSRETLLRSGPQ